uniref:Uncharacterized protein n=1 Tax=Stegastes partitus TaxID=144197 RepID=A0A3B4Z2Q7_9TELE
VINFPPVATSREVGYSLIDLTFLNNIEILNPCSTNTLHDAASHRRTELLHHHHAVFVERPETVLHLQQLYGQSLDFQSRDGGKMEEYLVFPAGSTYVVFSSCTHFPAAMSWSTEHNVNTMN